MGDDIEVGKVYFAKSTGDGSPLEWQELGEATRFDFLASGATEFNVQYDVGKLLEETSGTISFKVPWSIVTVHPAVKTVMYILHLITLA